MNNCNVLGLNIFKYNQAGLFVFSLAITGLNYMHGSSMLFWVVWFVMLLIINFIWYCFSDVRWNEENFVIEKFLKKRIIATSEFIKVERLFFNVFVIKFRDANFYYIGDHKSVFENSSDITNRIITSIKKID